MTFIHRFLMKRITFNAGERTLAQIEAIKEKGVYLDNGTLVRAAIDKLHSSVVGRVEQVTADVSRKKNPSPLAVPDFDRLPDEAVLAWLALHGLVPFTRKVAADSPVYHCRWEIASRVSSAGQKCRGLVERRCIRPEFDKYVQEEFTPFAVLRQDCERIMKERVEGGATL